MTNYIGTGRMDPMITNALTRASMISLIEVTYLFIDGAYLREVYDGMMKDFFGEPGELNFDYIKSNTGARKVFYYDCLDDIPRKTESPEDFAARKEAQESFFDEMRSREGYHVRLGTLSGRENRRRQKQVDVLLAVDMLNHAVLKNMSQAFLIAGDLDFKPVVDSLVGLAWISTDKNSPKTLSPPGDFLTR